MFCKKKVFDKKLVGDSLFLKIFHCRSTMFYKKLRTAALMFICRLINIIPLVQVLCPSNLHIYGKIIIKGNSIRLLSISLCYNRFKNLHKIKSFKMKFMP